MTRAPAMGPTGATVLGVARDLCKKRLGNISTVLASNPLSTEPLIDAIVEAAPACVRDRVLLQSLDWRRIDPAKVERMLSALAAERVRLPPWLAKSLVIGGHVLPAGHQGALEGPLHALHRLNQLAFANDEDAVSTDWLEGCVAYLAAVEDLDADVVCAALQRLSGIDNGLLAMRLAIAHWHHAPQSIARLPGQLDRFVQRLPEVRIRLAGFSTTHPLASDLVPAFANTGLRAAVAEAQFGQAFVELLQPDNERRDALILLLDLDGLYAPQWSRESDRADDALAQMLDMLVAGLEGYARRGLGPVLLNTIPIAPVPTVGLIDTHHPAGAAHIIHSVNGRLAEAAKRNGQIILIDGNRALACLEPRKWTDAKLWFYGRVPYSADATRHLAGAFACAYRALKLGTAKVLALDLDNTLWGGTFGEDGAGRLLCDDEFPGNAFKAFQRECLRLKSQGMLLTVISKNNPDAITAFSSQPGMLLKEDDFVATRINWHPKPVNIRSMAEELNLGLDSFVFVDDSPHEREAMRRMCPEVTVPELPDDPASRPQWLRALGVTWPVRLTEEDSLRSDMYLAERRRASLRGKAVSFEDYLRGLEQTLIIGHADHGTLARVAQMHLRTNQFNLTTERYDEADLLAMAGDSDRFVVLQGRVLDKFGDHGLVICATAKLDGEQAGLKSFLMSCRVVGRGVEITFLGELLKHLQARGTGRVEAAYIPTARNALVRDFYKTAGFTHVRSDGAAEIWGWELGAGNVPVSDFIAVRWGA